MNSHKTVRNNQRRRLIRGATTGVACLVLAGGGVVVADAIRGDAPVTTPEQVSDLRAALDSQLTSASRSQRVALLDGVVDRSELIDLGDDASRCSVANGSRPIQLNVDDDSVQWDVNFGREDSVDDLMEITDKCWADHVGLAERYYSLQNVPPVSEQLRINRLVADCLADSGYEATGWPAIEAEIDPSIEAACVDVAENS